MKRVVALLGQGVVPVDTPILRADDLGVLRGDGVFETMHVRQGNPWLLDEHLERMVGSATRLDLELPPVSQLRELAAEACAAWDDPSEAVLRLVCTRGPEGGGSPTVYAMVTPVSDSTRRVRREGVRIGTLSLGFPAAARAAAPWLLGGVKSLSYAVNMACQRWATAHGLDDVLWVSAEGYALEAPTSTLVWLEGATLYTVPTTTGILPGTTARYLFSRAEVLGWHTAERMVRPHELESARGVWLTSSVRGVVEVRQLDDIKLPESPYTERLQDLLGYPL